MKYDKEEVMKAVSDLKCVNGAMYFGSVKEPCEGRKTGECCHNEQSFEEAEQELKSFLSTALDAAYKAGKETRIEHCAEPECPECNITAYKAGVEDCIAIVEECSDFADSGDTLKMRIINQIQALK